MDWLWRNLGLVLKGGSKFSKSLIQFSPDGWGCVPSLLFGLRPNYVWVRVNGNFLPYPSPVLFSAPNPLAGHCQTTLPSGDSWTLTGKSGSVSSGVTAPFSWVLVHTNFTFVPSKSLFPQSCGRPVTKFQSQIPCSFQSLCWIPRTG